MLKAKVGSYVLATKYWDGDPCDHFCIGWMDRIMTNYNPVRYHVVDSDGLPFRGNGFRRVEAITPKEGRAMLAIFPDIANVPGGWSVWEHFARIREDIRMTKIAHGNDRPDTGNSAPLLLDYARCHDDACSMSQNCLRWLRNNDEGERLVHYQTLKETDGGCAQYIGKSGTKTERIAISAILEDWSVSEVPSTAKPCAD